MKREFLANFKVGDQSLPAEIIDIVFGIEKTLPDVYNGGKSF